MVSYYIITNNPLVAGKYPSVTKYFDVPVKEIFTSARDRVHMGDALVSHPLSGSVKPNESPYKSIVLSEEKDGPHLFSVQLMEEALSTLERLAKKNLNYSEEILNDFAVVDLDLLDSAIGTLENR